MILNPFGNMNGSFAILGKTTEEMKKAQEQGQKFGGIFTKQISEPIAFAGDKIKSYNKFIRTNAVTQARFNETVSDNSLTKYLQTLNGGAATVKGYNASLNTSRLSTIGLTIATTAMNMAITMGISAVLSLAVSGIMKLANSQKEAIETANELTSTYNDQTKEIKSNIDTVNGLGDEFSKLSKGVDDYGNNISLSADEYAKYKEIVSQIVDISPQLITGYDKEGNAIVNKNSLIERSIELLKEENRQKLEGMTSDETIGKIGKGKAGEYNKKSSELNNFNNEGFYNTINDLGGMTNTKQQKAFQDIAGSLSGQQFSASSSFWDFGKIMQQNLNEVYNQMLQKTDVFTSEDLSKFKAYIDKKNSLTNELDTASKALNPTLQLVPQTLSAYDTMSDAQKNFITNYVNGFKITSENIDDPLAMNKMKKDILDFTDSIANNQDVQNAINQFFSLDKTKLSLDDWKQQADKLVEQIANALGMDVVDLKVKLGLLIVDNQGDTVDPAEQLKQQVKDKFSSLDLSGFTEEDLKILLKPEIVKIENEEQAKSAIENFLNKAAQSAKVTLNLDKLVENIDKLQGLYDNIGNEKNIDYSDIEWILTNYPELLAYINDEAKLREGLNSKINEEAQTAQNALNDKLWGQKEFIEVFYNNNKALFDSLGIVYNADTGKFIYAEEQKIIEANKTVSLVGNTFDVLTSVLNGTYQTDLANFITASQGKATQAQIDAATAQAAWAKVQIEMAQVNSAALNSPYLSDDNKSKDTTWKSPEGTWYYRDTDDQGRLVGLTAITDKNVISALEAKKNVKMPTIYTPPKAPKSSGGGSSSTDAWKEAFDNDLKDLQYDRESGKITEENYYKDLDSLNNKYFQDKTKYLDEYRQYEVEVLDGLKKVYQGYYDDNTDYAEKSYKTHQNEDKYINDLTWALNEYWDSLTDEQKASAAEKIEDARSNRYENQVKDLEHQIYLLDELGGMDSKDPSKSADLYEQIKTKAHTEADRLRELGFDDNSDEIQALQKTWIGADNSILDGKLQNSKDYIDKKNKYNNWGADNEIAAWTRVVNWLKTEYPNAVDEIAEAEENLYTAKRDKISNIQSALEENTSKITDQLSKQSEHLDNQISKNKTLVDLLQKHYDIQNELTSAQSEADKQLAVANNLAASYGLSSAEKERLFSQEDYNDFSEKISEISDYTDKEYTKYANKIRNLSDDEQGKAELLTAEYERRVALKQQELEIVKVELNLNKKQKELENIMAEKNVRVLRNGQWEWTANFDNVKQATEELADLQSELTELETKAKQQSIINSKQSAVTELENLKLAKENEIKMINDKTEKLNKAFEKILNPVQDIGSVLGDLSSLGISTLDKSVSDLVKMINDATGGDNFYGGSDSGSTGSYDGETFDKNTDYKAIIDDPNTLTMQRVEAIKKRKAKVFGMNLTQYMNEYASGTTSARKGLSLVGEEGAELRVTNGEGIISADLTKNLMEWGKVNPVQNGILAKLNSNFTVPTIENKTQTIDQSNHIGTIEVNNPANFNEFMSEMNKRLKVPATSN